MRVGGSSVLMLKGLMSALRAGGILGVPSLRSAGELLEVFINHSSNLFFHDCADTAWLLLQWEQVGNLSG